MYDCICLYAYLSTNSVFTCSETVLSIASRRVVANLCKIYDYIEQRYLKIGS